MIAPNSIEYKHRDLNWLSFNERVLQEATDTRNPLYERIKFLAIFSSNLDEYFRVRVSQLRQIKRVEKSIRKKLALRPNKITKEILEEVKIQQDKFGEIYHNEIIPELAENGIHLLKAENYNRKQKQISTFYFREHVKDHLEIITSNFEAPTDLFLENNRPYFAVTFSNEDLLGLVSIPSTECGRFIEIENNTITFLDDIIRNEMPVLFPKEEITGIYEVKLSRDAELYIEDEFNGVLAEKIYESLAQRTDGQPTRLLYDASMPEEIQKKIRKLLKLGKIDMMPGGRYHNFTDFFSFPDPTNNPELHAKKLEPIKHRVLGNATDYFKVIAEKDQAV
ncbi:MAG TPA: hypothetical protein VK941_02550, partial [Gillisia sp.]|nr:hypothetical protein [Gillisia sp.]